MGGALGPAPRAPGVVVFLTLPFCYRWETVVPLRETAV